MKQAFGIIFFFCAGSSFAQNTSVSSDKRVFLPPLVVESTDAGKQEVTPSDAVPVTGQKYESSQQHSLMLVPVGNASGNVANTNNSETLMMSETATPLPASASTTSQSNNLTLIPANPQKP